MITATVTEKIRKMAKVAKPAKATKTQVKGEKPKAKAKAKIEPVAPAPVVEPTTPVVVEPVAPAPVSVTHITPAPAAKLSLKVQIFADLGLRAGTHRAVLVAYLVEHIGEQVPFTTLAATAWAGAVQKTNTTTSVSTSLKVVEQRLIRNKLADRYAIRREVVDGALTTGLYKL